MSNTDTVSIFQLFQHRFVMLLAMLVILIFSAPLVNILTPLLGAAWAKNLMATVVTFTLLSVIYAAAHTKKAVLIAAFLLVLATIFQIIAIATHNDLYLILNHIFDIALLAFTVVKVLQFIFEDTEVTVNTLSASVCAYLMLAIMWAFVYSLIELVLPGSFPSITSVQTHSMRFQSGESVVPLYYSIVTLSTLGYGDVVPASAVGRLMAAMEALVGQFYIAILVARLVGIHIAKSVK